MKMKSIAGAVFYVKDVEKTADFYEKLGFEFKKREPDYVSVKLNYYWMDFLPQDKEQKENFKEEALSPHKGAGMYTYISVENVDEAYKDLISKGLKPSSEPRDWPWGNREFVIRDPDGYKLVIFKKK